MPPEGLIAGWASAAAPPPRLTVSEWADAKRFLPETSSAKGARWRTSLTPYLRGIMDVVHEPGVRKVALRKCAQVGGSEALHNILGYFIEHDPCPMLLVHPTVDVAEEWSKERLADMLRTTPAIGSVIRQDESTLAFKLFPGGYLALGGANTPNTFARRAARIGFGDDVSRWPPVVGEEGDPSDLLENRTTTFDDPLVFLVSTPTLKHDRIDTLYERSDRRRYMVTCPVCGHEDWITWSDKAHFRVGFDDRDPSTARLECPSEEFGGCGAHLDESDRRVMIADGTWQPTAEAQETGLVGFHLPAMVSTFISLSQLVSKWLNASAKGKESLRVFINTMLAEGWEDRGARMEAHTLMSRREDYGEGIEVPAGASLLTCGVDVQVDRFELQVVAWGMADERWVVDWRAIPGDPKQPETRASLLEALSRKYAHALGPLVPIRSTCIDSGYATEEVYDFVLAHQARRFYATKGFAGKSGEPIVGKPSEKRYGRASRPVRLYPINVDDAKSDVLASLAQPTSGPCAMHFSIRLDTINEEFFAQLCAEHRETRYNKSGIATHSVWVQDRERNEGFDTAVLALAARRLANPNIRQDLETIAAAGRAENVTRVAASVVVPPAASATSRAPAGRRFARSSYLGG